MSAARPGQAIAAPAASDPLRTFDLCSIKRELAGEGQAMQRNLTAQLANQSGLEVISFQHSDCLIFERGETLKMFLPESKRVLGGTSQDRMVIGDLLMIFATDLERLKPPSKRYRFANFITGIPIANFPSITASSLMVGDAVGQDFFSQIHDLLKALPDRKSEWIASFGEDFFSRDVLDRCVETVRHLREIR